MTNAVVEQAVPQAQTMDSFKEIVKSLMLAGYKRTNGLIVRNVTITEDENYTRATISVKEPIIGYVSDDNGVTFHKGTTTNIFSSTFALSGLMKESEELSWMANTIIEHPNVLNLILNGSKIDIIQQEVSAGEDYVNPFSTRKDRVPTQFDHDVIINYVVNIELGKMGTKFADKLADKLMGF